MIKQVKEKVMDIMCSMSVDLDTATINGYDDAVMEIVALIENDYLSDVELYKNHNGYCIDCEKVVRVNYYNEKATPPVMTCVGCGQFVYSGIKK